MKESGATDPRQTLNESLALGENIPSSPPLFFSNPSRAYRTSIDSYADDGFLETQEDFIGTQQNGLFGPEYLDHEDEAY